MTPTYPYVIKPTRIERTALDEALNPNKPLSEPLSETERQVINTLLSCTKGEQPDPVTRNLIWSIAQQSPAQWTKTIHEHREIVLAIHSFFYGNLVQRSDSPCK